MVVPLTELFKTIGAALLGIMIAWVAFYVALLYGGYSNRNWAKAAAIAREQAKGKSCSKWNELQHDYVEAADQTRAAGKSSYFYGRAKHYARPCDPNTELPPIFQVYTWLAIGAGVIHFLIIVLSIVLILRGKA
jgi:hypothetical protein